MGASREWDTNTDIITIGAVSALNMAGDGTVALWVKPDVITGQSQLVRKQDSGGSFNGYFLRILSSKINWAMTRPASPRDASVSSVTDLIVDEWQFVAGQRSGSDFKIFIAQAPNYIVIEDGSTSHWADSVASSSTLVFGKSTAGTTETLNGKEAYVHIYPSSALSIQELQQIAFNPGSIADGLVGYWPLWGSDSPEVDLSGTGNNGTVSGVIESSDGPPVSLARRPIVTYSFAADAGTTVDVPLGSLELTALVPTITASDLQSVAVPLGSLELTGLVPTVSTDNNISIDIPLGQLSLTGLVPVISATANQSINIPLGSLELTGLVPIITTGANTSIDIPLGSLELTGLVPSIAITANQSIAIPLGLLDLSPLVPTITAGFASSISVPLGSLTITAHVPTVGADKTISLPLLVLHLTGLSPTIYSGLVCPIWAPVDLGSSTWSDTADSNDTWTEQQTC